MIKNRAQLKIEGTSLCVSYGKRSVIILGSDFKGLIAPYITKEHFINMASDMVVDFVKQEGYDWDYDSRELQRKLAIVYDSLK